MMEDTPDIETLRAALESAKTEIAEHDGILNIWRRRTYDAEHRCDDLEAYIRHLHSHRDQILAILEATQLDATNWRNQYDHACCDIEFWKTNAQSREVHFVTRAEAAEAEVVALRDHRDQILAMLDAVCVRESHLIDALEFYATEDHYKETIGNDGYFNLPMIEQDRGRKARYALRPKETR